MNDIYVVTSNKGKVKEFKSLLSPLGHILNIKSTQDLDTIIPDIDEPYETFRENALHKSFEYARRLGAHTLSDDSGLCVHSLGGEPGVYSARYAERQQGRLIDKFSRDSENNQALLNALNGVKNREAYYIAVVAVTIHMSDFQSIFKNSVTDKIETIKGLPPNLDRFYRRDNYMLAAVEGCCSGHIVESPKGEGGFGYDPIFYVEELGLTAAEMTIEQKNQVSHRYRATQKLLSLFQRYL